jgi:hypothetical protein
MNLRKKACVGGEALNSAAAAGSCAFSADTACE